MFSTPVTAELSMAPPLDRNSPHPSELVETALGTSHTDGCVVVLEERNDSNLRWAQNEIISNGRSHSRVMTVIALDSRPNGYGVGTVARSVTTRGDVVELVAAADAASREGPQIDETSPLVEPGENADQWDAWANAPTSDGFARLSTELRRAFRQFRSEDRQLFGFAEHQVNATLVASSTGLRRRFDQTDGRFELTAKSADPRSSAWYGVHAPDFDRVDFDRPFEAFERARSWSERTIELAPGRYETILPPAATSDLLLCIYKHASARDADDGHSPFTSPAGGSRLGERLFPTPLTLFSDPSYSGLECPPFAVATTSSTQQSVFDNGAALQRTAWIDQGTLASLICPRPYGLLSGREPRPLISNLVLTGGGALSLEEMISSTEHGLLLTSLWYIRDVDPLTLLVTGMTRDGVYLIEDGAVVGQTNNFRFNESPLDLLRRVTEVGHTVLAMPRERADQFRRTAMPPLRVPDFHMSSVSAAS